MFMKNLMAVAILGATTAMVGCGSDSDDKEEKVVETGTPCATVGLTTGSNLEDSNGVSKPVCALSGTIKENVTLTDEYIYNLQGYVSVGTGFAESGAIDAAQFDEEGTDQEIIDYMKGEGSATLTIDEGVEFRSSGRGSLVISRGSKIMANGTEDAPIIMSSIDAGFDGQGEWGGLVLQGFAKNNKCGEGSPDLICDTADEAGTGFHGGNDDADSSGSIKFLIVAEGGYEIAADSEVNGITLHSVGYGTTLENIMVYGNADDGIEFFGGAANVKNLILVDNGDESLDWDDGWRGNVQFVLARQGVANEGDHGIEADTEGADHANPESDPVVANVTFQENSEGADDLFRFKKATNGTLINIAADGYEECVKAEGSGVSVEFVNVLAECGEYASEDRTVASNPYLTGDAGESAITGMATTDFGNNTVELGDLFEVTGANGTLSVAPSFPSANDSTGFFTATAYVGAVDPSATEAWWAWAADVIPAAFE